MATFNIGDSRVLESRDVGDGMTIRRRREASDGRRFTTYERVEQPHLTVIKKSGTREMYDRDKLSKAIEQSVGKFFKSELEVEDVISRVESNVYALGISEVESRQIGDIVLDELASCSEVAYVRFASVYQDFKTLDDFVRILEERQKEGGKR